MKPTTLVQLFFTPTQGWKGLMQSQPSIHQLYMLHVIPFALIPPLMIYFSGKHHGDALFDLIHLIPDNRIIIVSIAFFLVQLVVVP
ncbi:MAG: hypothetical protein ACAH10_09725, partial [Methylophilaceae bacterium]